MSIKLQIAELLIKLNNLKNSSDYKLMGASKCLHILEDEFSMVVDDEYNEKEERRKAYNEQKGEL